MWVRSLTLAAIASPLKTPAPLTPGKNIPLTLPYSVKRYSPRTIHCDANSHSVPAPAVQPVTILDNVDVAPTKPNAPGRHQPTGKAVPQNALACIFAQLTPAVPYNN